MVPAIELGTRPDHHRRRRRGRARHGAAVGIAATRTQRAWPRATRRSCAPPPQARGSTAPRPASARTWGCRSSPTIPTAPGASSSAAPPRSGPRLRPRSCAPRCSCASPGSPRGARASHRPSPTPCSRCSRRGVHPVVPSIGSVGEADLATLAHLALPLVGLGRAELRSARSSRAATRSRGQASRCPSCRRAMRSRSARRTRSRSARARSPRRTRCGCSTPRTQAVALTLEGFEGNPTPTDPRVVAARPFPGHAWAAAQIRAQLEGSALLTAERAAPAAGSPAAPLRAGRARQRARMRSSGCAPRSSSSSTPPPTTPSWSRATRCSAARGSTRRRSRTPSRAPRSGSRPSPAHRRRGRCSCRTSAAPACTTGLTPVGGDRAGSPCSASRSGRSSRRCDRSRCPSRSSRCRSRSGSRITPRRRPSPQRGSRRCSTRSRASSPASSPAPRKRSTCERRGREEQERQPRTRACEPMSRTLEDDRSLGDEVEALARSIR